MTTYILKRLVLVVPVLIGVSILVFAMRLLVPGDPVKIMLFGQGSTPEAEAELRETLGLNLPVHVQYIKWISGVVRGDLGKSIRSRNPVTFEIAARYPNTIRLAVCSLILAVSIGVLTGVAAAVKKDSFWDLFSTLLSLIGISMPAFWLGLLMIYFFAVKLGWFPVMGSETPAHLVLPTATMGLIASAISSRMTRSSMLEVLGQDYIRTARAKGLSERVVIYKHALKNALIPVVTIVGLQFGYLLGGAFIIEVVFAYHGIGEAALQAIQFRDFPMIQGIVLLVSSTTVLINLVVDLLYSLLNPRIRYE